jgi:hypothetical protein
MFRRRRQGIVRRFRRLGQTYDLRFQKCDPRQRRFKLAHHRPKTKDRSILLGVVQAAEVEVGG